jgi:branched-chain amino acid transport system substrate-binding protein
MAAFRKHFSFFLLLICIACSSSTQNQSEEIRIGFYGPLSGNMASFGTTVLRGIELGLEEINRKGLNGRRMRLYVEDDRGNPEEAQTAVSRLITRDRVIAILGHPSSSGSLAAAPVCQQYGIPMITPTSTNIKVTQAGDHIFRVCWIDPFQGEIMARFAVEDLKGRKMAILFDVGSDYSSGLAQIFTDTVERLGAEVSAQESFSIGDTNFSAQLTSIIAAKPDVLYLPTYYNETGLIMRQLRALGSKMTVIGSDGWDSPQSLQIGGEALNGSYYCTHFLPSDPDPVVQQFVSEFKKRHSNTNPSMGEALGYDSISLLADAIRRSSLDDTKKIRDAIAATKDFHGVTGVISIDENRNARKPVLIVKIEDQKAHLYRKLSP